MSKRKGNYFPPNDAELDERRRERGEQLGRKQLPRPLFDPADVDPDSGEADLFGDPVEEDEVG